MAESTSPALDIALAYHQAWTSHDLDKAMTYIADEIVCDAPAGRLEGAAAYREFMGPFVQILTSGLQKNGTGRGETALTPEPNLHLITGKTAIGKTTGKGRRR